MFENCMNCFRRRSRDLIRSMISWFTKGHGLLRSLICFTGACKFRTDCKVVVVDSDRKTCNIIDIAVPGDAGIVEKEEEKIEKYQDPRREVARLWNVKAKVVPMVVGALGAVTLNLSKHLDAIGLTTRIELLQKVALSAPPQTDILEA